jgi:hypothetical protein
VEVQVRATARSKGQPVSELHLLVDGRPTRDRQDRQTIQKFSPAQADAKGQWSLTLEPGRHTLSVRALAHDTYSISSEITVDVPLPMGVPRNNKRGTLYYVGIGINQFQNHPNLKLEGAVPDVRALEQCLKKQCAKRFAQVEPIVLTDKEATRAAILKKLTDLQDKLKPSEDVVLVHCSSHGEVDPAGGLYLLCHDSNRNNLKQTALSGDTLREVLGRYTCPVLLLLDTCHAGKFPVLRPATDPLSRLLADDSCGVAVMTAALAHQKAEENQNGGFFTKALIDGLSGQADPDKFSKRLFVHNLFTYAYGAVAERTNNRQLPFYLSSGSVPPIVLKE